MSNSITIEELIRLEKKYWAGTKDIQKIGNVGYNTARDMRNEIRDKLVDEGWTLPRYQVPMEYVMKRFPNMLERLESCGGVTNAG